LIITEIIYFKPSNRISIKPDINPIGSYIKKTRLKIINSVITDIKVKDRGNAKKNAPSNDIPTESNFG
jgi:hypothetical protein